ncbi:hypothetical protein HDU93_008204 [Gonapodya sp. JEL0774]|nr:hypothetical protein HDU93_008204 [Gonapodya sp. JEL0774]
MNKGEPPARKSYQLRALLLKSAAYQRRQIWSNLNNVVFCPFQMLLLAWLLQIIVQGAIDKASKAGEEYLYCSNVPAVQSLNHLPISDTDLLPALGLNNYSGPPITAAKYERGIVKHANSFGFSSQVGFDRYIAGKAAGASLTLIGNQTCERWMGTAFPDSWSVPNPPYDAPLNSSFADPSTGWLGAVIDPTYLAPLLTQYQSLPWSLVYAPPELRSSVGGKASSKISASLTGRGGKLDLELSVSGGTLPFKFGPVTNTSDSGLLSLSTNRFYVTDVGYSPAYLAAFGFNSQDVEYPGAKDTSRGLSYLLEGGSLPISLQLAPYFQDISVEADGSETYKGDPNAIEKVVDDKIGAILADTVIQLARLNKSVITKNGVDPGTVALFLRNLSSITTNIPSSAIYFRSLDFPGLAFEVTIQAGTDQRVALSSNLAPQWFRSLLALTDLSNMLRFRHFPSYASGRLKLPLGSLIGPFLYPWGVSFMVPLFAMNLVQEKEQRISIMMQMNGLKLSTYYVSKYLEYFGLAILSSIVFLAVGTGFKLDMFVKTGPGPNCKHRYIFVYALLRGLADVNNASWVASARPYELSTIRLPDEVAVAIIFMVFEIPFFLFAAAYSSQVLPSQYGVRRPFWFPITYLIRLMRNSRPVVHTSNEATMGKRVTVNDHATPVELGSVSHIVSIAEENDDVRDERARVLARRFNPDTTPLYMEGMQKIYESRLGKPPKVAVNDVSIAVEQGTVFGLLGPNGAGKTTLINMLTGIYPPTNGHAVVAGHNMRTDMDGVYRNIGVCPQHDILWEDLTVVEHLLFYARLKGIPPSQELQAVAASIETVRLSDHAKKLAKKLSGGEKRRLSIAISLVGNPLCVFLDEPTTGLDPEFSPVPGLVGNVFEELMRGAQSHGIEDWGISQTSLEEVFLAIISDEDADAD